MAARLRKTHQDDVRAKIQSSVILQRLAAHVAGTIELSTTQVAAAKILLDKSVSNAPTEVANTGGPFVINLTATQAAL